MVVVGSLPRLTLTRQVAAAAAAAAASSSETSVYPNKRALFSSGKNLALRAAGETVGIPRSPHHKKIM